ncbi:MAG: hypothetical protein F6K19_23145 [Cyanothece sp. SIO1E1]|nr:hypothetical protein [Cyanothece sp. SIO1E1]
MYRTEVRKPFPGWICVTNDVNCTTVRVRTEVSDVAAAQACQSSDTIPSNTTFSEPLNEFNSENNSSGYGYDHDYSWTEQDRQEYLREERRRREQNSGTRTTDGL